MLEWGCRTEFPAEGQSASDIGHKVRVSAGEADRQRGWLAGLTGGQAEIRNTIPTAIQVRRECVDAFLK